METNERITVILAHLREGIAEIYAQKKLDKLDKELDTQDWDNFVKEIVVATTHQNGTYDMLISAKLSTGYLVVGITRELNKKPLLHCSSIYINIMWSML